jgi:hypothetical protein
MQIPVLIEPMKNARYRARGQEPFAVSATGATPDEALTKLRAKIEDRLKNGVRLVGLDVGPQPHPLAKFAGMFRDDPDFEDVLKIIAENRRKMDEDPSVP